VLPEKLQWMSWSRYEVHLLDWNGFTPTYLVSTDADTETRIQFAARAYLLYLVGCTLFSDKNGTKFPPHTKSCLRTWVMFLDLHSAQLH